MKIDQLIAQLDELGILELERLKEAIEENIEERQIKYIRRYDK